MILLAQRGRTGIKTTGMRLFNSLENALEFLHNIYEQEIKKCQNNAKEHPLNTWALIYATIGFPAWINYHCKYRFYQFDTDGEAKSLKASTVVKMLNE